jgi:hypothetical protein
MTGIILWVDLLAMSNTSVIGGILGSPIQELDNEDRFLVGI